MQLSRLLLQVLFFFAESGRAPFVRHLRQAASDLGREMRVTEMREEELLREATTREQRAQIVETFIRHAFSKVQSMAFQPPEMWSVSTELKMYVKNTACHGSETAVNS